MVYYLFLEKSVACRSPETGDRRPENVIHGHLLRVTYSKAMLRATINDHLMTMNDKWTTQNQQIRRTKNEQWNSVGSAQHSKDWS